MWKKVSEGDLECRIQRCEVHVAVLNEKVAFDQRSEGSKGVHQVSIWRKGVSGSRNGQCKRPEVEDFLCWRSSTETNVAAIGVRERAGAW